MNTQLDPFAVKLMKYLPKRKKERKVKTTYEGVLLWLLLQAFAIFCGMGINNTHMYEKAVRAMAKQRVALEVLSYHTQAPNSEVQRLKVRTERLFVCLFVYL